MLLVSNADENNSLEEARTSVESMNLRQKSEAASVASDENRMAADIVPGVRWTDVLFKKATSTKQIEEPEVEESMLASEHTTMTGKWCHTMLSKDSLIVVSSDDFAESSVQLPPASSGDAAGAHEGDQSMHGDDALCRNATDDTAIASVGVRWHEKVGHAIFTKDGANSQNATSWSTPSAHGGRRVETPPGIVSTDADHAGLVGRWFHEDRTTTTHDLVGREPHNVKAEGAHIESNDTAELTLPSKPKEGDDALSDGSDLAASGRRWHAKLSLSVAPRGEDRGVTPTMETALKAQDGGQRSMDTFSVDLVKEYHPSATATESEPTFDVDCARRNASLYRNADLSGLNFVDLDLSLVDFHGANLAGATFENTTLDGASFEGATLIGTVFRNVVGNFANFMSANLTDATLERAALHGSLFARTTFRRARITGSDFTRADLQGARFDEASIAFTTINYAWFDGALITSTDIRQLVGKSVLCGGGESSSHCARLTNPRMTEATQVDGPSDEDRQPGTSGGDDAGRGGRLLPKQDVVIETVRSDPKAGGEQSWGMAFSSANPRNRVIYNKGTILDAYLYMSRALELFRTSPASGNSPQFFLPVIVAVSVIVVAALYVVLAPPSDPASAQMLEARRRTKALKAERARSIRQSWLEPLEKNLDDIPVAFAVDMSNRSVVVPAVSEPQEDFVVDDGTKSTTRKSAHGNRAQTQISGIIESLSALSESLEMAQALLDEDEEVQSEKPSAAGADASDAFVSSPKRDSAVPLADEVESPKSTIKPNTPATVTRNGVRYQVLNPLFDHQFSSLARDDGNTRPSIANAHAPLMPAIAPMPRSVGAPVDEEVLIGSLRSLTPRRLRKISVAAYRTAHDMEQRAQRTQETIKYLKLESELAKATTEPSRDAAATPGSSSGANKRKDDTGRQGLRIYNSPLFESDAPEFRSDVAGSKDAPLQKSVDGISTRSSKSSGAKGGAAAATGPAPVNVLDENKHAKGTGVPRLIRRISKKFGSKSPLSRKDPNIGA